MSVNDVLSQLVEAGERAVAEVQREVGWDTEEPCTSAEVNAYIEALEGKVRELGGALKLAALSQGR